MISTALLAAFAACIYMLIRNTLVYTYRTNLIHRISESNIEDISDGRPWHWRYEEYNSISYNEMMLKFWKPLDSFYPRDPARKWSND